MKKLSPFSAALLALTLAGAYPARAQAPAVPAHLPGELSADDVLNGVYPYPPSPPMETHDESDGLAPDRLGQVPPPGVHPRILISPDQLPDLRRRLKETATGRELMATLVERVAAVLHQPGWSQEFYDLLVAGKIEEAQAGLIKNKGVPPAIGHYQPYLMALTLESLRCLIAEDKPAGEQAAAALVTYARLVEQVLDRSDEYPLYDDVWRSRIPPDAKNGTWTDAQSARDIVGYHLLGYDYDFIAPFMTEEQRAVVRGVISKATKNRLWMGARLPHHFRDWNWVAIGLQQPLLALSIEGEEGYDPRVYKLGVQVARDYLTYGISPSGTSTEAVGYTGFGLNWANPFFVAATRRGEKLLTNSHLRGMMDWYIESLDPQGGKWTSHGDGGDGGPSPGNLLMFRYFFPQDPKADFLWQQYLLETKNKPFAGKPHMVEAILFATDAMQDAAGQPVDHAQGAKLGLPLTWFDPIRSSLIARSAWSEDAAKLEFECRTDSFGASHEHADRGNFTFAALGRDWAKEDFRSIETRHHNSILIDGMGQGFWPGPGKWLGLEQTPWGMIAACDAKDPYSWEWPKEITTEPLSFVRFQFERWKDYTNASADIAQRYAGLTPERDPRPSVAAQWQGFADKGDPRMWDEDTWPVRYPHNPVQRAFRTLAFVRDPKPYLLIVDDIQKDEKERLYEWLMQTGLDTALASFKDNDIILCDASVKRDENGVPAPRQGDRLLLVRILNLNEPKLDRDYQSKPSVRLETFERKDTLLREEHGLSGARSFGLDTRLVIPSRAVAPDFKILLYPLRQGDPLPVTTWTDSGTTLSLESAGGKDEIHFRLGEDGRTRLQITHGDQALSLP